MTPFYLLYLVLLVAWILLVPPMVRQKGPVRYWLVFVCLAGLAALAWEIWVFTFVSDAIRVDILLISVVLLALYGLTALALFLTGRRTIPAVLSLILLAVGGGMSFEWMKIKRESDRLTEVFHERNKLLFEAKFRDRQTYRDYFGATEAAGSSFPAGHWLTSDDYYTRLVVNADGDIWLFYACGDSECALHNNGPGLQPADGKPDAWQAALDPPAGVPVDVTVEQRGDDLAVTAGVRQAAFRPAQPPVGQPGANALAHLGPFVNAQCRNRHSEVRQIWLWRDGERLFAVAIVSTLVAGQESRFVPPLLLGEGKRRGNAWAFGWERNGQTWEALIEPQGETVSLGLTRNDGEPVSLELAKGAIVTDEVIALAPLSSVEDWRHWFDIVLTGHFSTAKVPKCV